MDAVEAAVTENADYIAALRVLCKMRDDGVGVWQIRSFFAGSLDDGHELFGIQPLVGGNLLQPRHLGNDDGVGIGER